MIMELYTVKRKVKILIEIAANNETKFRSFPVVVNTNNWLELVRALVFCSDILSSQIQYYCKGTVFPVQLNLYLKEIY